MITATLVAAGGFALALSLGAPDWLAVIISLLLFFCTLPFAMLTDHVGRRRDSEERKIRALEKIARNGWMKNGPPPKEMVRPRPPPVPPQGGSGTVYKDDRAIIIDNRQVNIYNGIKPKE